ncbi:Fc.00g064550.m01.CDS01 [Cosmosporella sp. VM-42]
MLITRRHLRALCRLSHLFLIYLLISLLVLDAIRLAASIPKPRTRTPLSSFGSTSNQTFYVASIHHNTASFLATTWSHALARVVDYLGPEQVYVSAVDYGSDDGTNIELLALKETLDERGVGNTFSFGAVDYRKFEYLDILPTNNGDKELDIRSLVKFRNRAMKPLEVLSEEGRRFDTVLWIDDNVVFDTQDIMTLIDTHDGDFAAACSMPRSHTNTLTLRDDEGKKPASSSWPWFRSLRSRTAAQERSPIPVFSCWEGLVIFDAAPFINEPALHFRTIDRRLTRQNLAASERCLIHAGNYLAARGVWINPNVRVQHYAEDPIPEGIAAIVAVWVNRLARWTGAMKLAVEGYIVRSGLAKWMAEYLRGSWSDMSPDGRVWSFRQKILVCKSNSSIFPHGL